MITHGVFFLLCPYYTTLYWVQNKMVFKNVSSCLFTLWNSQQIVDEVFNRANKFFLDEKIDFFIKYEFLGVILILLKFFFFSKINNNIFYTIKKKTRELNFCCFLLYSCKKYTYMLYTEFATRKVDLQFFFHLFRQWKIIPQINFYLIVNFSV